MAIPPAYDSRWKELVEGKLLIDIEFFPLKLLLARQRLQLQTTTNPEVLDKCVFEVRQLFLKNQNHPIARRDLNKIFKRKGLFGRRHRS
ncbi:MAG: hypothetical protein FK734_03750 [Asgard group archaeon]|nr:hypothetical protein [Asgard group archaeon]